jgi:hypothetical protein
VGAPAGSTGLALAAGRIDLANHPLANEAGVPGLLYNTHELVTKNPLEASITLYNLQVSVADAGQNNPNTGFTRRWMRLRIVRYQLERRLAWGCSIEN